MRTNPWGPVCIFIVLTLSINTRLFAEPATAEQEDRLNNIQENLIRLEQESYQSQMATPDKQTKIRSESGDLSTQSVPSGCVNFPLPTTSGSPRYRFTIVRFRDESAVVTIWRKPCIGDRSKSAVLMRFAPSNDPFICSSSFTVIQNGIQYDSVKLVNTPDGNSFCDDLLIPQTMVLDQWTFDSQFDEDRAFQLIYDGFDDKSSIDIGAYSQPAPPPPPAPEPEEEIVLSLEEPPQGSVYSGVGLIRGFATSMEGIERIELYVDGEYKLDIPYGGARGDVARNYPEIPDSRFSGFGMTFNYNNAGAGQHTIRVRAISKTGQATGESHNYTVERFHDSYISKESAVDISNSDVSRNGQTIAIENITVEGEPYDVRLRWKKESQGFEIVEID